MNNKLGIRSLVAFFALATAAVNSAPAYSATTGSVDTYYDISLSSATYEGAYHFDNPSYRLMKPSAEPDAEESIIEYHALPQHITQDPLSSIAIFAPQFDLPLAVQNGDILVLPHATASVEDWLYLLRFENNTQLFLYTHGGDGAYVPEDSPVQNVNLQEVLDLNIAAALFLDNHGFLMIDPSFLSLPGASLSPNVQVTYTYAGVPVPIPSAIWLFSSVLAPFYISARIRTKISRENISA